MEDTDWRPSACPVCGFGFIREAAKYPVCNNPGCDAFKESQKIMITAKEARDLAGPSWEEQLVFAYDEIRKAARNKQRKVLLRNEFWTRGGYDCADEYKAAVKKLEELGFTVKFHYEALQFVNMYTVVQW